MLQNGIPKANLVTEDPRSIGLKNTPRTGTHPKVLSAVEKGEISLILRSLGCPSLLKRNVYTFYVKKEEGHLQAPSSPPTCQNSQDTCPG